MPKFTFYKYNFYKTREQNLFSSEEGKTIADAPEIFFGKQLEGKSLNLFKPKNSGESVVYRNDIRSTRNGVTVMRVCNEKQLVQVEDYKEKKIPTRPFCHVIIDNRPGKWQIAIEHTKAFDNKPDKVRDILKESLHAALADYGIGVDISAKAKMTKFWEVVDWRITKHSDSVKQIVIDLPNPDKVKNIDASKMELEKLKAVTNIVCALGGAKGTLKVDSDAEGTIRMEQMKEDFVQMANLCGRNGYDITVHFEKMGVYRCGELVKALYNLEEKLIEDFVCGQMAVSDNQYALIDELDSIYGLTKDYNDALPVKKRRKGNNQE